MWRMVQEKSALVRGQVHKRNLQVLIRYIILSYAIILHNVYLHYDIHKSHSGLLCKLVSDWVENNRSISYSIGFVVHVFLMGLSNLAKDEWWWLGWGRRSVFSLWPSLTLFLFPSLSHTHALSLNEMGKVWVTFSLPFPSSLPPSLPPSLLQSHSHTHTLALFTGAAQTGTTSVLHVKKVVFFWSFFYHPNMLPALCWTLVLVWAKAEKRGLGREEEIKPRWMMAK